MVWKWRMESTLGVFVQDAGYRESSISLDSGSEMPFSLS